MDDGIVIYVPAARGGVEQAGAALDSFCAARGIPPDVSWRVKVSLDETLSNVVRHGGLGPSELVTVAVRASGGTLELTVTDRGPAFNPLTVQSPDLAAPLEHRSPGGVGIVLVQALMDHVEYERREGHNVLVLRKRLDL